MTQHSLLVAAAVAVAACSAPTPARADDAGRAGRHDFFVLGHFSSYNETEVEGTTPPVDVEYDQTFGIGLGYGYNLSDHWNVNGTVVAGEATFDIGPFGQGVEERSTFIAPDLNVDWNITDAAFTPFLTAGAGAMIFTGGEIDEVDFSYGAGAGVRWDFSDDAFLKLWYRAKWFELDDTNEPLFLHTLNVGIGVMR